MRNIATVLVLCIGVLISPSAMSSGPIIGSVYGSGLGGTDYPWNMFHYDAARNGATPATAPVVASLMWSYDTGATIYSSPAVADGMVFIGTYNGASNTGSLFALDEYTGGLKWVFPTNGPIYASPAVANGVVYIASRDSGLYAVNENTGQQIWGHGNISPLTSSPVVADGMVFYGTWYRGFWALLMALDAATGTTVWQYYASDTIISSPSVHNNHVFFGQNDGFMVALNETTGVEIWKVSAGNSAIASAASVGYGSIFVGTDSKFMALDEMTGTIRWTFNTGNRNATSGALANGLVFFGTGRGNVHAVDTTSGLEVWRYVVGSVVSSSPALALGSGVLVVGSHDGYVYALNLADGSLVWRFLTSGPVSSSPAVADGRVFVGSQDHKVYGIGNAAPSLRLTVTAGSTILKPGEVSSLAITVTDGSVAQSGVTVSLSSTVGGGFTAPVETGPGFYSSNFTAPLVSGQVDTSIGVRASKSGYLDGTGAGTITLLPFPALSVQATVSPGSASPGGEVSLSILVRNGSLPVEGAKVNFTTSGTGSFSSPVDGGGGNYTAVYTVGLQDSNPTLTVQASKDGFSTGEDKVVLEVGGTPDLTKVKLYSVPLWMFVAGAFLLGLVVLVLMVARRSGQPDASYHGRHY